MGLGKLFSCFRRPSRRRNKPSPTARRQRTGRRMSKRRSSVGNGSGLSVRTRLDHSLSSGGDNDRISAPVSDDGYFSADDDEIHSRASFDDFYSPRAHVVEEEEEPGIFDRLVAWWDIRKFTDQQPTLSQALSAGGAGTPGGIIRTSSLGSVNNNNTAAVNVGGSASSESVNTNHREFEQQHQQQRSQVVAINEDAVLEPEMPSTGCISLFTASQSLLAHKRFLRLMKPRAGSSSKRLDEVPIAEKKHAHCAWEDVSPTGFQVRSANYMKSRIKQPCDESVYKLIGVDMYQFDFKIHHIAQHVQLPATPTLSEAALALPKKERLAPMLIFNLQLPTYSPTLFGGNDGPGVSLVYYFGLPDGFDPAQVRNKQALAMLQRFTHNGREFDGQPTRDRLKLIGRVVNVEEWIEKGPLSSPEAHLLKRYNDTPLLTRPQHRYYTGPGGQYLEIDLDVHNYAYLARRALAGYINRLKTVIFENAFLLQGNREEELPEMMIGGSRVYKMDFLAASSFPAQEIENIRLQCTPDGEPASEYSAV